MIWYSRPRAMKYNRIQQNYSRLTLPREHSNATTKAYALPRDWSVEVGDDEVYHIVRLHRKPVLRTYILSARGWRLNLSACPLQRAPHE